MMAYCMKSPQRVLSIAEGDDSPLRHAGSELSKKTRNHCPARFTTHQL